MKIDNRFAFRSRRNATLQGVLCVLLLACAVSASAHTVYDGGKALRQNCASGTYANPYTDENGGRWSYHTSSAVAPFTNLGSFQTHTKVDSNQLDGWGGTASPHLKVNITGSALTRSAFLDNADPIEPDELVIHPAGSGNTYTVLRFTIPEDGWYSAFVSFRDTSLQPASNNPGVNSGASVYVTLGPANGDKTLVSGIVSLEHVTNSSPRLDFQIPAQRLTAGMRFNFAVGNNVHDSAQANPHSNDATGVKVIIVKEDEGSFYDVGRALKNEVSSSYTNPHGNTQDGAWHYLRPTVPSGVDFVSWAPTNISYAMEGFAHQCKRTEGVGFCNNNENKSPFVVVNTNSTSVSMGGGNAQLAPQEACIHPNPTTGWTTVRFRPPVSGWYSGSIVARDVNRNPDRDGVRVYLNIADHVVDSAYIDYNDKSNSTAHIAFDARLLAAGEPVDIVVSPTATIDSDATAISAIFRRETGDVYDAATSFTAQWTGGNRTHPFPDVLGGGATWDVGTKTNAQVTSQFYSMPANLLLNGTDLSWCVYASGTSQANGNLPRIALATNGVVSSDSYYLMSDTTVNGKMLRIVPNEMFVHPNTPGYQSSCPTLKAKVPADGIYRMRGHARDLNTDTVLATPNGADGVLFSLSAGGSIPAAARVSIDTVKYTGSVAEASIDGDRLWLKAGDAINAVIDPGVNISNDGTGLSVCYIKEGDVTDDIRVVNVHVTQRGSGKFSPTAQRPREGWTNWNTWNALRPSDAASAECRNCYEGDGTTKRNVTVTLTRDSGSAIAYGSSADANIYSYASSSDATDTYTFTIGNLKKNEPYALYLYSAKNSTGGGNATFTVGGVTKSLDETWIIAGGTKVLTRFDTVSDANGEITGTFAAKDANGGAFNGLTLVGDLPAYVATGTVLVIR